MTSPVIGPVPRPDSPNVHWPLPNPPKTATSSTTTTTLPLPPQPQQGLSDPIIIKRMGELEELIMNLVEENQALEARLGKQGSRINKLETMDLPKMITEQTVAPLRARFKDLLVMLMKENLRHRMLEENYDKGHADHRVVMKHCRTPSVVMNKTSAGVAPSPPPPPPPPSGASGASGTTGASDSAQAPPPPPPSSSTHQGAELVENLHEDRPATSEPAWTISSSDLPISIVNDKESLNSLLRHGRPLPYELTKVFIDVVHHLVSRLEECHNAFSPIKWRWNSKDLEYLRYGRKIGRPALFISKMKAAFYPDVGLEQLVPDQILDVERGVQKIILRRADLKEYVIAERDFKYMYPSDFEDLYLLNLQGHLNHLSPDDKKTQLNLTKPRWDATGFEFKHDYTVIDSPRAVTFRDRYGVQMIMRFNEIHKFSDGTLQQIDEALDYRVKEFRVNRTNPGMNTRFWTKKDVVRSKEFMFAIQKRLKTRRIFRNLKSFVGGRIREGDYRNGVDTYAVRITWLIADIEDKYHGPSDTLHKTLPSYSRSLKGFLFHFSRRSIQFYRLSHSELVDIEKGTNIEVIRNSTHNEDGNPSRANIKQALGKYGDFDGYTSDDPILKLEILSRRWVKMNLTVSQDQVMVEMEIPRSSGVNSQPYAHT
ncbi:hypothetical protein Tco_0903578 [Tanacetum coccineum]